MAGLLQAQRQHLVCAGGKAARYRVADTGTGTGDKCYGFMCGIVHRILTLYGVSLYNECWRAITIRCPLTGIAGQGMSLRLPRPFASAVPLLAVCR